MALLIDSSVFIGIERRHLTLDALASIGPSAEQPAVAAMTISELVVGALRADTLQRRIAREAFVDLVIDNLEILPFDLEAARSHAVLTVDQMRIGQPIGANDAIIAASALAGNHSILSENSREFRRVAGLVVHEPSWPA